MQYLIQEQALKQEQRQHISQLQHLSAQLISLSAEEMEQRIIEELETNPALGKDYSIDTEAFAEPSDFPEPSGASGSTDADEQDKADELDQALEALDDSHYDDSWPHYDDPDRETPEERANRTQTAEQTFLDSMKEQMLGLELSADERAVMEYLIASLDDSGFLSDDISDIADELEIYHNLSVTPELIEQTLKKIQTFDPAGVGARNLQECLLLQIDRRKQTETTAMMRKVVTSCFDDLMNLHWNRIAARLKIDSDTALTLRRELRKLNPTPGSAPNETKRNIEKTIVPDFTISVDQEQNITFTLNDRNIPTLLVDPDFLTEADSLASKEKKLNRNEQEALHFSRHYIYHASLFIEAAETRKKTLLAVMNAIIHWQRRFFLTGDEAELRPMRNTDIAAMAKVDHSTVSRTRRNKYFQTDWGLYPLEFLFSEKFKPQEVQTELSSKNIKQAIADIVAGEDKAAPLNDEEIANQLNRRGMPVARRTVAKYREQMGIPVYRIRKEN